MFLCLLELPWQYILWEVFLYSDCDMYDTQTTTNPIRYIAPILYASSQIGAAMLDSQLGRDLWRHARVKREVFREGSAAVIWLV